MKLNYALTCDNAFTDESGRINIIQTFENIKASDVPAIHPKFTVITNYLFENDSEKGQEYTQLIELFFHDSNEMIASLSTKATPPSASTSINFIGYFVGIKFEKYGIYDIKIKLNGGDVKTLSIVVEKDGNNK